MNTVTVKDCWRDFAQSPIVLESALNAPALRLIKAAFYVGFGMCLQRLTEIGIAPEPEGVENLEALYRECVEFFEHTDSDWR